MTKSFQDMMHLFSCGAMGIDPQENTNFDIEKVLTLAIKQGVWQTVFISIKSLYEKENTTYSNHELFDALRRQVLLQVTTNTQRLQIIDKLIKKFESEGITCCILKGDALTHLYAVPECRVSSDTDILISPSQKNQSIKVLKELGFEVHALSATCHHIRATHPIAGLVELHLHLHDEIFEDVWFDNKMLNQEEFIKIKAEDGTSITTLGITDGLVYITLHYIKHFLTCGAGIRQLMDVLLYMKKYKNEIDWDRFNELLRHLKYKKLVDNIIGIGVKYLDFKKEDLPLHECDENIMERMLTDIEKGGVFGKNEPERSGFYLEYTKARFNRFKKGDYNAYVKKWWRPNVIKAIFPSVCGIAVKFPYVKKTPILYPVAWIHRVIKLLAGIIKKEKSVYKYINPQKAVENNETIKKRMELIRELDMI